MTLTSALNLPTSIATRCSRAVSGSARGDRAGGGGRAVVERRTRFTVRVPWTGFVRVPQLERIASPSQGGTGTQVGTGSTLFLLTVLSAPWPTSSSCATSSATRPDATPRPRPGSRREGRSWRPDQCRRPGRGPAGSPAHRRGRDADRPRLHVGGATAQQIASQARSSRVERCRTPPRPPHPGGVKLG